MKSVLLALAGLFAFIPSALACRPAGYDHAALLALKAEGFAIADDAARNRFALALTVCLAEPDPMIRDGVAYEAFHHFLRERLLTVETMRALESDLALRLTAPEGDGFERPFAALVLSEVARADRIDPYLTPQTRARLLGAAIDYFGSVRDYRGFDAREGWRHGVAHSADLLLQLSLNPAFARDDLLRLRDAVATQVAPEAHFYTYGEPQRMAAPILMLAQRGVFTEEEWISWFARFGEAAQWRDAFTSQTGLARRHNTIAFLFALYVNARANDNAVDDALLPGVEAALRAIP